jgi:hypothetical protein
MDGGQLILIGGGLALLCVVLFVIGTVFQVLGTVFGVLGNVLDVVIGLFNIGPVPGCGCVIAIGGLALCGVTIYLVSNIAATCSGPNPVNFCLFFGG